MQAFTTDIRILHVGYLSVLISLALASSLQVLSVGIGVFGIEYICKPRYCSYQIGLLSGDIVQQVA